MRLMDGSRSVRELVLDQMEDSGELELDTVADLVADLRQGNFLDRRFVDVPQIIEGRLHPISNLRAKLRGFAKTLSIEWDGADRLVRTMYRWGIRFAFTTVFGLLSLVIVVWGLVEFILAERSGRFGFLGTSSTADSLVIIALGYLLTFVHELGHASVLIHKGRQLKNAGFMIYFGSPSFFVDSSESLVLQPSARIFQSAAGPYAELLVAGIASLFVAAFPGNVAAPVLFKFCLLNYFVCFMNLIPLLELDGYWILSDVIQVPDLRQRSLEFFQHDALHKVRERERWSRQESGLFVYAVAGVIFSAFCLFTGAIFWWSIFGGLLKGLWAGGAVGKVLLLLLIIVIAGPILRGISALAKSAARRLRRMVDRIRFRLERGWRVRAAELIDGLEIFDDLPEDVLSELAGEVSLVQTPNGKVVVRQGEVADSFYIVDRGAVQAVEEQEDGTERAIRTLGPGESFGELGLVESAPRAATIRAAGDSRLFKIGKATFDRLLSDVVRLPRFSATVQQTNELRQVPAFSKLEADELVRLLDHEVVTEGEEGDSFYAVGSGRFEVSSQEQGRIRELGPGDHFGEIALLMSVPRTATVRALTPARVFRLDREGFASLVAGAFRAGKVASWAGARTVEVDPGAGRAR
jgi:putative peptide zinc metalloprotease protein